MKDSVAVLIIALSCVIIAAVSTAPIVLEKLQ